MKAFLVGFLALVLIIVLAGIGALLYPLLAVLGVVLQLGLIVALGIFAIWLLGKFILLLWQKMK